MTASTIEAPEVPATDPTPTGRLFPEATMAGTEGTNQYRRVAESSFGVIGYRLLGNQVRIRLEPATEAHAAKIAETLTRATGWKQPGDSGQNRFSTVLPRGIVAVDAFEAAYALVKRGRPLKYYRAADEYQGDLQAPAVQDVNDSDEQPEEEPSTTPEGNRCGFCGTVHEGADRVNDLFGSLLGGQNALGDLGFLGDLLGGLGAEEQDVDFDDLPAEDEVLVIKVVIPGFLGGLLAGALDLLFGDQS